MESIREKVPHSLRELECQHRAKEGAGAKYEERKGVKSECREQECQLGSQDST